MYCVVTILPTTSGVQYSLYICQFSVSAQYFYLVLAFVFQSLCLTQLVKFDVWLEQTINRLIFIICSSGRIYIYICRFFSVFLLLMRLQSFKISKMSICSWFVVCLFVLNKAEILLTVRSIIISCSIFSKVKKCYQEPNNSIFQCFSYYGHWANI